VWRDTEYWNGFERTAVAITLTLLSLRALARNRLCRASDCLSEGRLNEAVAARRTTMKNKKLHQ
jgi:hypothetical protein